MVTVYLRLHCSLTAERLILSSVGTTKGKEAVLDAKELRRLYQMVEAVPGGEGGDVIQPTQDCRWLVVLLVVGKVGCEGKHRPLEDAGDEVAEVFRWMELEVDSSSAEVHLLKHNANASDEDADDVGSPISELGQVARQRRSLQPCGKGEHCCCC